MDDQVLQDALGADAGCELGVFGFGRRGLADIVRGNLQLLEREIPEIGFGDGAAGVRDGGVGGTRGTAGGG
jgi:hypothetical protein